MAIVVGAAVAAAAFTPSGTSCTHVAFAGTTISQRTSQRRRARCSVSPPPSSTPVFRENVDVFLWSFEALVSANRSRSWMAVCTALRVWPCLESNMRELGIDPEFFGSEPSKIPEGIFDAEEKPHDWLLRKLSALASITQQGDSPDAMLGCDAVLLSRLLLEEQRLDCGRSNGRGGKYGGNFHPSVASDTRAGERPRAGSRPLTVGELYENWHEIKDVTRRKYPFVEDLSDGAPKRTDPLPKIRQCLTELYCMVHRQGIQSNTLPSWQHLAYDVLFQCDSQNNGNSNHLLKNTMLLLGHEAQIPWALTTLSTLCAPNVDSDVVLTSRGDPVNNWALISQSESNYRMKVVVTTSENAQSAMERQGGVGGKDSGDSDDSDTQPSLLLVVPDSSKGQTHSNMIEQIVNDFNRHADANSNRNVFVTHSSLEVLKRCKSFLGDDAPRLVQGQRTCSLPHTAMTVTLFFPRWADTVHPSQQNDAQMDPWLNLVGEDQLLELVSGRVVAASR